MTEFIDEFSLNDPSLTPVKKVRRGRPPRKPKIETTPDAEQTQLNLHTESPLPQKDITPTLNQKLIEEPEIQPLEPKQNTETKKDISQDHPQKSTPHPPKHPQHKQKKFPHLNQNPNQHHQNQQKKLPQKKYKPNPNYDTLGGLKIASLNHFDSLKTQENINLLKEISCDPSLDLFDFNQLYNLPLQDLFLKVKELGILYEGAPHRRLLLNAALKHLLAQKRPVKIRGVFEKLENIKAGVIVHQYDNYRINELSSFVPELFVKQYGLQRGHTLEALILPPRENEQENCSFVIEILSVMDQNPNSILTTIPFNDLTPYYPTKRIFLESTDDVSWDNLSMRVVDILTPIGLGQRGLIVAPPRTGKTMLLQSIVHSIAKNTPDAHIIVLLIDERPEEVTDFKRQIKQGEVISSTFDQPAESHVHVAEMVIEKARRMVEQNKHVVIILDSITRLARAYNTMMPSSGKILSGGIEATSLRGPKRFFGSARNIENGGSLTILASALIDTGSKMDEVIFEEFKGAGNMELHLDRELVNKRLFPAIAIEKSGTRKEELLYHPAELEKIYGLRRAMKGIPPLEAIEMLISRIKRTKNNAEFLIGLNR